MCTVTFIPSRHQVCFTSNRDENTLRARAIYPEVYRFSTGKILFPKDADAGGTWIAVHENGDAVVFLNGGITKHIPNPPYRKSRGLILLELIDSSGPFDVFQSLNLKRIEPFTAIIWQAGNLYECRWDGSAKYVVQPDHSVPHIWSSVTLYGPEVIARREQWFREWLNEHPDPTREDILKFHQFTGDGDSRNDLRMNRDGETFTVSITSLQIDSSGSSIKYLDLRTGDKIISELNSTKTQPVLK